MKKVSCKMFFTVVWRGICQVLGWFFGLFGYKRDGKFAKCVWGLFAVSASIVMAILAITASTEFYDHVKRRGTGIIIVRSMAVSSLANSLAM